jgi:hemerythrin-like metal-binding protein
MVRDAGHRRALYVGLDRSLERDFGLDGLARHLMLRFVSGWRGETQMKELEWKDEYSVGISIVDLQHRRIFDCIISILGGPSDDDRLRAEAEIIRLLGLLQEHFALEESMMRKLDYPEIERHIEEHRQFNADVHELAQKSLRIKGGVSGVAMKIAHKWLTEHILTSDRDYAAFFRAENTNVQI